jgi:phosphomannomutase
MTQMVKFSVAGLRGVFGEELKIGYLVEVSQAFARFMGGKRLLLARDSRGSSTEIYEAVKLGLIRAGMKLLEAGMVTTPTAVYASGSFDADAGLVITASHNPPDHNGLKFLQKGRFLVPVKVKEFISYAGKERSYRLPVSRRGNSEEIKALLLHLGGVINEVGGDKEPRLRVGLDPVNGAAGPEAFELLESLNCEVHAVNSEPNGRFGRGPEPVSENLQGLRSLVRDKGLDVGFAFDPDGDRLAFVDENARAPGEEYTLPLCAQWALERTKGDVAVNLSTSRLIGHVARGFKVDVHRTPVGEAYVVDKLSQIGGRCGGEGNGGFGGFASKLSSAQTEAWDRVVRRDCRQGFFVVSFCSQGYPGRAVAF